MLTRQDLHGTWGTVLLPIGEDDGIEWEKLQKDLDALALSGLAGIYTNGSAGEFFSQTHSEFLRLSQMVAETCSTAGLPFQIGVCHPCAGELLERVRMVKDLAPGAMQVILPDWFPLRLGEALSFLERVAEQAAPVPLVLYMPPHAKGKLSLGEIAELARKVPSLVGIKVAGGDATWYKELSSSGLDLAVFVAGHRLASGYEVGAKGSYSNVACLHPRGAVLWNELMKSDLEQALIIEREIQAFLQSRILPLCGKYVDAAIDKLLAYAGGWGSAGLRLRWPYQGVSQGEADAVRDGLRGGLPRFFDLVDRNFPAGTS